MSMGRTEIGTGIDRNTDSHLGTNMWRKLGTGGGRRKSSNDCRGPHTLTITIFSFLFLLSLVQFETSRFSLSSDKIPHSQVVDGEKRTKNPQHNLTLALF